MSNFENVPMPQEQEDNEIRIGEIYIDPSLEGIFQKDEFTSEIQKINARIEKYLEKNETTDVYDFRIYGDRARYEEYFRDCFKEIPEEKYMNNDMMLHYNHPSKRIVIAKFMEPNNIDPNDPAIQKYLSEKKLSLSQLETIAKENYRDNVYPTLAHELTHTHSFFEGIDYRSPGNKWAQEMICVFIDQQEWESRLNSYGTMVRKKAWEQARNKNLYNEIIKDFQESDFLVEDWERLFYPFLEKKYGKSQLKEFWGALWKEKSDIENAFKDSFNEHLEKAMGAFYKTMATQQ